MSRAVRLSLVVAVLWLAAGCGGAEKAAEPAPGKSARSLEPKYADAASAFARAVASRNYELA